MLKFKIDDVESLPEALREFYAEGDGGYVLQVEGVAEASELERFKGKALKAEQEAIERRKALEAYKALGSPDDIKEAMSGKGKGTSDQEAIVARMKAEHEKSLADLRSRAAEKARSAAMSDFKAQLAAQGVQPDFLDFIAYRNEKRLRVDDDWNVTILSEDGSAPMVGSSPNGGATLADLAKAAASGHPAFVADKGKGGSGTGPGARGATGKPAREMRGDELAALRKSDPGAYEAAMAERRASQ